MLRDERSEILSVGRETLWSWLSDTDRLNRDLNLPPTLTALGPGAILRGSARFGPLTVRYVEEPYSWVKNQCWQVRRVAQNGPASEYRVGVALEELGAQTRLSVWCKVEPRGVFGKLLARKIARISVDGMHRACAAYADFCQGRASVPHPNRPALHWEGATLADRLRGFLALAPDDEVALFRPYALADRSGEPRREVLTTCLQAVGSGELELSWRLLCPACQGTGEPGPRLDELAGGEAHCPSCDIRYRPAFDRDVEVCFSHARRKSERGAATFCRGGPHRSAHVVLQWLVGAGKSEEISLTLPAGEYLLRASQTTEALPVTVTPETGLVLGRTGKTLLGEKRTGASWRLESLEKAAGPTLFRLESLAWRSESATAAEVTSLGAFRRHFGSEVLSPGVEVTVRRITILFTDLKGSTAMYAEHGDAPSYATVREHFALLTEIIEREGGGVIKTLGDSVMAAFLEPASALRAALAIQQADLQGLVVKCGLHMGPALAIEANGGLDYFGQTVNLAARIQAESLGHDIVIAESLSDKLELPLSGWAIEPFEAHLRGAERVQLVRLTRLSVP
jgi:adenylate cyclase